MANLRCTLCHTHGKTGARLKLGWSGWVLPLVPGIPRFNSALWGGRVKGPNQGTAQMGPRSRSVKKRWRQQHGPAVLHLTLVCTRWKHGAMGRCCGMSWFLLLPLLRGLLLTFLPQEEHDLTYGVEGRVEEEEGRCPCLVLLLNWSSPKLTSCPLCPRAHRGAAWMGNVH